LHSLGVTSNQADFAAAFMFETKGFTLRRIVAPQSRVAHRGNLRTGEQIELPHTTIISPLLSSAGTHRPSPEFDISH
jgi:hypothetical protein